jgi:UDP-glucose 4-epimerase
MSEAVHKLALVTGGAGFIGSHLVGELIAQGYRVRVLDNFSSGKKSNLAGLNPSEIELIEGDIRDKDLTDKATEGSSRVFHLAGLASVPMSQEDPELCLDVNGVGTLNVISSSAKHKVKRLVYASTSAVYGDLPAPHIESLNPKPDTPYAAIKLLGENLAYFFFRQKGLSSVSLRYFNVYGPRQSADGPDSGVIPLFIRALKSGNPPIVYGDGAQTRDFVHVKDVARATFLAALSPKAQGVYNIASGTPIGINELLSLLKTLYPNRFLPPLHAPARSADPSSSFASVLRAKEDLNFEAMVPLAEGLSELIREAKGDAS